MAFSTVFNGISLLYEAIVHHIAETNAALWCDADLGQLEDENNQFPIDYPAVLIRFDEVIWQNTLEDGTSKRGVANISLKCIFKFTNEEEWQIPLGIRTELMEFFDVLGIIHSAVNNLSSENYSRLELYNQFHIKTKIEDMLWVTVLQYRCNVQTGGTLIPDTPVIIDSELLRSDNDFMERKEYNLMNR